MSIELNIQDQGVVVKKIISVTTKIQVGGGYFDFDNTRGFIFLRYVTDSGEVAKEETWIVSGVFYSGAISTIIEAGPLSSELLSTLGDELTKVKLDKTKTQELLDSQELIILDFDVSQYLQQALKSYLFSLI